MTLSAHLPRTVTKALETHELLLLFLSLGTHAPTLYAIYPSPKAEALSSSWCSVNKCLLTLDGDRPEYDSTQVQLGEPVSFLGLFMKHERPQSSPTTRKSHATVNDAFTTAADRISHPIS